MVKKVVNSSYGLGLALLGIVLVVVGILHNQGLIDLK